jgi:chemotaxis methyl-accepting protein methylase
MMPPLPTINIEVILCRNVMLIRHLVPGGYFFAGHSESLQSMDLPIAAVGPAVYRKVA